MSVHHTSGETASIGQMEAWKNAFIKLLPQHAFRNPVMAIVWLGTIVTFVSTVLGLSEVVLEVQ